MTSVSKAEFPAVNLAQLSKAQFFSSHIRHLQNLACAQSCAIVPIQSKNNRSSIIFNRYLIPFGCKQLTLFNIPAIRNELDLFVPINMLSTMANKLRTNQKCVTCCAELLKAGIVGIIIIALQYVNKIN